MLVKVSRRLRGDQSGSTLVSVMVTMIVLTLFAITLAAVVTSTTRSLVSTRESTQAKQAADAGLAAVVAAFKRGGDCPASTPSSNTDDLSYTTYCEKKPGNEVAFRSTGKADGDAQTTIKAVYRIPAPVPKKEPALVTRAPLALDSLTIKAVDPSNPATVWVVPDAGSPGDFTCNSGGAIAGSVYLPAGTVFGSGGCVVGGDVYAEKSITIGSGTTIRGDLVSLNGNVTITGGNTIDGSIYAKGNVTGSSLSGKFVQSIHAGGNLSLSGGAPVARDQITYGGTFTFPHSDHDAWAVNSVTKAVIAPPQLPTAPQWDGFTQSDLDALVGSGVFTRVPWTGACAYSWYPEHEMVSKIKGFTSPTLVDATHCSRLELHQYSGNTELKTDVIFVAPSFNIEDQDFTSADGAKHRLWFIAPEVDGRNCSSVPPISIKGTIMVPNGTSKISGMIFTQCTVDFPNGGEGWQGSIQAGKMTGKPNFWYRPVGFPGQADPGADGGAGGTPQTELVLLSRRVCLPSSAGCESP